MVVTCLCVTSPIAPTPSQCNPHPPDHPPVHRSIHCSTIYSTPSIVHFTIHRPILIHSTVLLLFHSGSSHVPFGFHSFFTLFPRLFHFCSTLWNQSGIMLELGLLLFHLVPLKFHSCSILVSLGFTHVLVVFHSCFTWFHLVPLGSA